MALLGPANNYKFGENYYDTLATAFQELKTDINSRHSWNRPIEQLDGLTMSFISPDKVKISHAKYVVASRYAMKVKEQTEAVDFLNALVVELAKKYKNISNDTIKFKKLDEQQDIQLYGKVSAYGSLQPEVGRYMVTTSRIYTVETKNLKDT